MMSLSRLNDFFTEKQGLWSIVCRCVCSINVTVGRCIYLGMYFFRYILLTVKQEVKKLSAKRCLESER